MQMDYSYIYHFLRRDPKLARAIRKQEKWRQTQIDIYYRTGRPLFNYDNKKFS